jgi:hypothetical protein
LKIFNLSEKKKTSVGVGMVLWELVGDINKLSLEATTKRFVGWVVGGGRRPTQQPV